MCEHHQHIEPEHFQRKRFRLADFFNMWWDEYVKNPAKFIEPEQYKAVAAIRVCRTEVLGVDYYACPDCGEISEVRHSCKNRFCPACSWKDTIEWSEKIKSQMMNIPHRHVVFTLPHQLNGLLTANPKELLNFLARNAADTFKDWMKAKYNIKIGIIAVIHTFGEKKNLHPHIHMIVSWGGIDYKTGELVTLEGKEQAYVNYSFLQKKFRCKFEDEFIALFDSGKMNHKFANRQEFMRFVKKINNKNWQIHLEPPMECPASVVRYIGRYSKRACLSEYKITNIEGEYISFRYKDYTDRDENGKAIEKELRLHYRKFFPLLLQHVPKPYFRMVRYYGAYGRFQNIPDEYKATDDEQLLETIETEYKQSDNNPKFCGACTKPKEYIYTIVDLRKKGDRTEPFDIQKHKHLNYQRLDLLPDEQNLKNAA